MYKHLKALREELGLTQAEFGESVGIAKSTYNNYEIGAREPKSDFWIAVATKYGVTIDYLMGYSDSPRAPTSKQNKKNAAPEMDTADSIANRYKQLDNHGKLVVCAVVAEEERRMQTAQTPTDGNKIIHINWNDQPASAGRGFDLGDEHMGDWMVQYNELTRKADFCLNVQGKSMEPKFQDSDIVLVRKQPAVDVGEIGLFVVDGKGYIKQQGADRLISLNPDYDDIYPNEFSDVRCVGKVIGALDPSWIVSK